MVSVWEDGVCNLESEGPAAFQCPLCSWSPGQSSESLAALSIISDHTGTLSVKAFEYLIQIFFFFLVVVLNSWVINVHALWFASFMVRHQQCNLDFLLFSLQLLRKSWIRVCRVSRIDWPQCFFVVFCTNIKWKRLTELLRQFLDLPPWQCVIVIMLIKWPSSFALLSFVFFLSPLCLSLIRSCYSAPHSAALWR